jgi:hypothetical protein
MGIKSLAKEVGKEVAISTLTGLILADEKVVVPMDMVAIPAYQAYLLGIFLVSSLSTKLRRASGRKTDLNERLGKHIG